MKNKYDILSFHPRRHHNFEQAEEISKEFDNFLHVTSFFFRPSFVTFIQKLNKKVGQELNRRSSTLSPKYVKTIKLPEFKKIVKEKLGQKYNFSQLSDEFSNTLLNRFEAPKICIGFDSYSQKVFEKWKGKSFLILDLVIGLPQFRAKIDAGMQNFKSEDLKKRSLADQELYNIYEAETKLADLILCGSEFVKQTCLEFGVPESKLHVINYGVNVKLFDHGNKQLKEKTEKLKFVFIGAVGYRKGADQLIEAWQAYSKLFPDNELHFYGHVEINLPQNKEGMFFHGAINQLDLIEELKTADILAFPTTFEGSSYSIYQAMAMKLAIITTPHSGTVLKDRESALITPIGRTDIFLESMIELTKNISLRNMLAQHAYNMVKDYTWQQYGKKLNIKLKEVLNEILL